MPSGRARRPGEGRAPRRCPSDGRPRADRHRAARRPAAPRPRGPGRRPSASCSRCCRRARGSPRARSSSSGDSLGIAASSARLASIGLAPVARLLDERRRDARDRRLGEVPAARELQQREAVAIGDRPHCVEPRPPACDPALGAVRRWSVSPSEPSSGDVVVEQAAVVDHAREHAARRGARRPEARARPGQGSSGLRMSIAQSISVAEALQAGDHVEREAVGRAGRDADASH